MCIRDRCWGHAVSKDLLHWEQKETALYPDSDGVMYSGSGIVNEQGLLGLPEDAHIYFYTCAGNKSKWSLGKTFNQRIAYSTDGGNTLVKLEGDVYKRQDLSFISLKEGSIPQAENEIIMDVPSLDLLGVPARTGEKVTLLLTVKGKQVEREFVLSGYWEPINPTMNVGFAICSRAYTEKYADELKYIYNEEPYMSGSVMYDLMFKSTRGMDKSMDMLVQDLGYSLDDRDDNYLAANVNWAYLSNSMGQDPVTMMTIAAALALIILTGYLIIYNIFQISVIRDIRFYGLLKTIGTCLLYTSKQ